MLKETISDDFCDEPEYVNLTDEWFMEAITIKDGLKQSLWFHEITIEEKGNENI